MILALPTQFSAGKNGRFLPLNHSINAAQTIDPAKRGPTKGYDEMIALNRMAEFGSPGPAPPDRAPRRNRSSNSVQHSLQSEAGNRDGTPLRQASPPQRIIILISTY